MNSSGMKQLVVIGGGVVGVTTAWALAEAGHRVTLVEREAALGTGASRANGGSSATATCRRWPMPACR
ncbi:FAD-dependent oxidoreductase [Roseateles chitinivorans]|uniref:FAD-dependent oxidoreductase n=1 Tax=Roseateles chitinivorans TaxID=2917965 RepID=UPI003D674605